MKKSPRRHGEHEGSQSLCSVFLHVLRISVVFIMMPVLGNKHKNKRGIKPSLIPLYHIPLYLLLHHNLYFKVHITHSGVFGKWEFAGSITRDVRNNNGLRNISIQNDTF